MEVKSINMDWILENPREGIRKVIISQSIRGKYLLIIEWNWSTKLKPLDDYLFPSDSAAKRYYSTNYQSKSRGSEKPKWIKDETPIEYE